MNIKQLLGLTDTMRIGTTSSSPFTGSPTFDKVPFHIDVGRKPALNVYVLIERDDPDVLHYGRIIEGTEENPRAEPLRLQQNQAYQVGQRDPRPGDEAPHVTRIMQVEVLGEIRGDESTAQTPADLTLDEPGTLAQTGKTVYQLPSKHIPWLLGIPTSPDDGFAIGVAESGDASAPFILPMEAAARHIAVAGKTGVGKSYFGGVLVEEFHRQGIT